MDFKHIHQSAWIGDIYKQTFTENGVFKPNGFFVEIGVGYIARYSAQGYGGLLDRETPWTWAGSNTFELLEHGWSGIYVDPVHEFLDDLKFLGEKFSDRFTTVNVGASDRHEECVVGDGENLNNPNQVHRLTYIGRKVECKPTTVILEEASCPVVFDLLSVDVESYEEKVLRGLDFNKFKPKMIVVEIDKVPLPNIQMVIPSSYKLVRVDNLNAVLVNES